MRAPDPRNRRARSPTLTRPGRKACLCACAVTDKVERALLDALRYYTFDEFVDAPQSTSHLRKKVPGTPIILRQTKDHRWCDESRWGAE